MLLKFLSLRSYGKLKGISFQNIFNDCKKLGTFPKEWKKSAVVTLTKAADKDPSLPTSYRPICLLPFLGKILEGVILNRLKETCEPSLLVTTA